MMSSCLDIGACHLHVLLLATVPLFFHHSVIVPLRFSFFSLPLSFFFVEVSACLSVAPGAACVIACAGNYAGTSRPFELPATRHKEDLTQSRFIRQMEL